VRAIRRRKRGITDFAGRYMGGVFITGIVAVLLAAIF